MWRTKLYLKVANVMDDKVKGDIEEYLANLKKDLDVTLDVPLDQVKAHMEEWVEPNGQGAFESGSQDERHRAEVHGRSDGQLWFPHPHSRAR